MQRGYRSRWKIETAFQHLAQVMRCEIQPLCYPQAALFCFANALVAYNAWTIVKAAIDSEQGRQQRESLSHYFLGLEIAEATDGMLIALPVERWWRFAELPPVEFAKAISRVAAGVDISRYKKSVRGPKKKKTKKKHDNSKVHVSTKKILQQRRT